MHEKDTAGEANPGVLTRPILVPIDATDVAEGILPYVSQLAKGADVPLLLHGVVDPDTISDGLRMVRRPFKPATTYRVCRTTRECCSQASERIGGSRTLSTGCWT